MKLRLAYYGDPILRKKTEPVAVVDNQLKELVANMIETMDEENGIGLAAPQVHRSLSVFVTKVPFKQEDESWAEGEVRVFINPKIISYSEEKDIATEGCLSIPKINGDVARPVRIVVKATDLDGNLFTEEFTNLDARVIMHENDHINGVLYIDRMDRAERKKLEPLLREIKKNYSGKK